MSDRRRPGVRLSMQLRLTLWNTSVLALLLTTFAVAGWVTLSRVLRERGDATVRESARAISGAVVAERRAARVRGDTARIAQSAARDVLREMRTGDLEVLIVDDAERVVAANSVPQRRRSGPRPSVRVTPAPPVDPDTLSLPPQVRDLLRTKLASGEVVLRTLSLEDLTWRAALIRVNPGPDNLEEPALVVGVLRSDEEDRAVLNRVTTTLLFAIPFALVITILAGFALARRSLAPIDEMAATAARISAATLSERLPVANPYDELGRLASVINDLLGRVDDAFRAMKQFVADASHELRTPIAIVRGEADVTLQRSERTAGEYREALAVIRDESVRLSRIVDDLFLLARADAASPLNRHERVDLAELLGAIVRSVRTIADDRGVAIQWQHQGDPADVVTVDGDSGLLRRLLLNLLDNALKFTPRGGTITVLLDPTATRAVVRVVDTGPGVAPDLRPRLFDRFVRAAPDGVTDIGSGTSLVPTASGAGLGLAIAQAIAHAHGGHIQLEDTTAGSCFRVTLPRA